MSPLSQCQVSYIGWAAVHFLGPLRIWGHIRYAISVIYFYVFCFRGLFGAWRLG